MEKLLKGMSFKYLIDLGKVHDETILFNSNVNPNYISIILPVLSNEKIGDKKIGDRRVEVQLIYSDEYEIMKMQSEIDNMVKKYGVDKIKTYLGYTDTDNIKLKGANNNGKK
jgi:hypothetical protein